MSLHNPYRLLSFAAPLIGLVLSFETGGAAQVRTIAHVDGRLIDSVRNTPIAEADVALMSPDNMPIATAKTDVAGQFDIDEVTPGRYVLRASAKGYITRFFGASRPRSAPGILAVLSGQTVSVKDMMLTPQSIVSGQIVSDRGVPVEAAAVQLLSRQYFQGAWRLLPTSVPPAISNDRGEFRITGVSAGKYYLGASPLESRTPQRSGGRALGLQGATGYGPAFYPGVTDFSHATELAVETASEASGLTVILTREPMYTLSGTLRAVVGALPTASVVTVFRSFGGDMSPLQSATLVSERGDTFEVSNLAAGDYQIIARSAPPESRVALTTATITDQNTQRATLSYGSGLSVPVQVRSELRTATTSNTDLSRVRITLRPDANPLIFFGMVPGTGGGTIADVPPGRYRVAVTGMPRDTFIKELRFNEDDLVANGGVTDVKTSGQGTSEMLIVVGTNGGRIEGSVRNSKMQAQGGALVTVVPDDPARSTMLTKQETSDQFGVFRIGGLAPGRYVVFAWEDLDSGFSLDPDFRAQFALTAKRVTVANGASVTMELQAVPSAVTSNAATHR